MSERNETEIKTEVVTVDKSEKASVIISGTEATKCNVARFFDCLEYNRDNSEIYHGDSNARTFPSTRVGLM